MPLAGGGWLYLPIGLDAQALRILIDGAELDPAIALLCKPGDVAFDVGANLGEWAVPLARITGAGGAVFSFEPVAVLADAVRRSLRINGAVRAQVIEAAVADQAGKARMNVTMEKGGDGALSSLTDAGGVEVDVVTIDGVVAERHIERLDLLKIDVEGAEPQVLAGAAGTIGRLKPKIVFESGHEGAEGRKRIAQLLKGAEYDLIGVLLDGVVAECDWAQYEADDGPFADGRTRNLLALPAEKK